MPMRYTKMRPKRNPLPLPLHILQPIQNHKPEYVKSVQKILKDKVIPTLLVIFNRHLPTLHKPLFLWRQIPNISPPLPQNIDEHFRQYKAFDGLNQTLQKQKYDDLIKKEEVCSHYLETL